MLCVCVSAGSPYLWLFFYFSIDRMLMRTYFSPRPAPWWWWCSPLPPREHLICVVHIRQQRERERIPPYGWVQSITIPDLSMFGTWLWIERKRTPSCALWCIWCVCWCPYGTAPSISSSLRFKNSNVVSNKLESARCGCVKSPFASIFLFSSFDTTHTRTWLSETKKHNKITHREPILN